MAPSVDCTLHVTKILILKCRKKSYERRVYESVGTYLRLYYLIGLRKAELRSERVIAKPAEVTLPGNLFHILENK